MYNGKTVTLCIPTLLRYDLLEKCIASAEAGEVVPDKYVIIDNGGGLTTTFEKIQIYTPRFNIGVAASWNWFYRNVPEVRIVSNDDVQFHTDTIKKLVEGPENQICCMASQSLNAFSLCTLPDHVMETVGYFDESISPNWGYFEDNDFHYRMKLLGQDLKQVETTAEHVGSATLKSLTPQEKEIHHMRFRFARDNYIRKWGGLPGQEKYSTPYGR